MLDKQGRARSEIAALYTWRYNDNYSGNSLGNLSNVIESDQYKVCNPGFAHTFQCIDVPSFQGKGEFCPTPYFYQNLGEAEYVVAVYQYMRLLGYPSSKISILTTYNGQKELINDVLKQRCSSSLFGTPSSVSTVDTYQGQQNDYILLSLVRTESIGHLKDIRRLVVAMSRARLGLYVFCRQHLFQNCYELAPSFNILLSKPSKLQLVVGEGYNIDEETNKISIETRHINTKIDNKSIVDVEDVSNMGILVYQMVQQAGNTSSNSIEMSV